MAAQSGGSDNDDMPNADKTSLKSVPSASVSPSAELVAASASERIHRASINVHRPVYTQVEFNEKYNFTTEAPENLQKLLGFLRENFTPSSKKSVLLSLFPFISIMSQYSLRRDLFSDIIAGLTVGIMHIPQGQYLYILFHLPEFLHTRSLVCLIY